MNNISHPNYVNIMVLILFYIGVCVQMGAITLVAFRENNKTVIGFILAICMAMFVLAGNGTLLSALDYLLKKLFFT